MPFGETAYLALVLAAFAAFMGVVGYVSISSRLHARRLETNAAAGQAAPGVHRFTREPRPSEAGQAYSGKAA